MGAGAGVGTGAAVALGAGSGLDGLFAVTAAATLPSTTGAMPFAADASVSDNF